MLKDELTIVLLLKGRDNFSVRWFDHAVANSLPCKVLVADGGHDHGLENRLRLNHVFDKIDCDYIKYPFDENIPTFFRKVSDALKRVKTPFVVLASNDDFYFFDALAASMEFLKGNPDFACSRGEIWDFSVIPRNPGSYVYGEMCGIRKLYHHPTVSGESAIERVGDFAAKFHSSFHDVIRTPLLAAAIAKAVDSGLADYRFAEECFSFLIAVAGKIHRGDQLYMLHQAHPDMAALTDFNSLTEWVLDERWQGDFDLFAKCVAAAVSEADGTEFYRLKCDVMKIYVSRCILHRAFKDLENNALKSPRLSKLLLSKTKTLIGRNKALHALARNTLDVVRNLSAKKTPGHVGHPEAFQRQIGEVRAFLKRTPQLHA